MNKRYVIAGALVAALAIPAYARAHEGHPHKVMGTVATLQAQQLQVKATDGKMSTITINDKTKVLRGTAKITLADIKAGERVVVTAVTTKKNGKSTTVASEVKVAAAK
jgi:uncharacterized ubiquitin-like protein YukD